MRYFVRLSWGLALALALSGMPAAAEPAKRAARPFSVPSSSMMPALLVGDYLMADMTAYDARDPERGDLVVLVKPGDGAIYLKRVIGLPGDRIRMVGGVLHINGAPVRLERLANYVGDNSFGEMLDAPRFRETLPNGASYEILDTEANSFIDETDEHIVPPESYFLLGDNRDNSNDSRIPVDGGGLGDVPRQSIIGKATGIYWSKDPARIGKMVK